MQSIQINGASVQKIIRNVKTERNNCLKRFNERISKVCKNLNSLEELARFGESSHRRMFESVENKFKNGSLNMTFSELNLLNG
jgi:hypothetical protein